jgi:hypothetical protein
MIITARIVGLATLIVAPLAMVATMGTGWQIAIWGAAGLIGGAVSMVAEGAA